MGFGDKRNVKAPLVLCLCTSCGLVQLRHTLNPDFLFRNYYYKSGVNQSMRDHLTGIVRSIEQKITLEEDEVVLDVGSNDGTLLRAYSQKVRRIGFEPAKNLLSDGRNGGNTIINNFFNSSDFLRVSGNERAKVITAISMFYDLEDPNRFLTDIRPCLRDDGLLVIQQNYLPSMLENNAFDNIVHEHLEYYSMQSLKHLLEKNGLRIVDVEFNSMNGGSFRTYLKSKDSTSRNEVSGSVRRALEHESRLKLLSEEPYKMFGANVTRIAGRLRSMVQEARRSGRAVGVYGASTRGNTLLQVCGLDYKSISFAAERNPAKWDTRTTGTNIPVISEEEARMRRPDYLLILPWHFLGEFVTREWAYLMDGGKFIIPLPEPCVLRVSKELPQS